MDIFIYEFEEFFSLKKYNVTLHLFLLSVDGEGRNPDSIPGCYKKILYPGTKWLWHEETTFIGHKWSY